MGSRSWDELTEDERQWWIGRCTPRVEGSNMYGKCDDCELYRWLFPSQVPEEGAVCSACLDSNERMLEALGVDFDGLDGEEW
jgi:hypothetical protein